MGSTSFVSFEFDNGRSFQAASCPQTTASNWREKANSPDYPLHFNTLLGPNWVGTDSAV